MAKRELSLKCSAGPMKTLSPNAHILQRWDGWEWKFSHHKKACSLLNGLKTESLTHGGSTTSQYLISLIVDTVQESNLEIWSKPADLQVSESMLMLLQIIWVVVATMFGLIIEMEVETGAHIGALNNPLVAHPISHITGCGQTPTTLAWDLLLNIHLCLILLQISIAKDHWTHGLILSVLTMDGFLDLRILTLNLSMFVKELLNISLTS